MTTLDHTITSGLDPAEAHYIRQAIEWVGKSGARYRYYIWPRGAKIQGVTPGNFLHVKVAEDGTLRPVYVSHTDDLNVRLISESERECINSHGATQLHIHANTRGVENRAAEAADLLARWNPECNHCLCAKCAR